MQPEVIIQLFGALESLVGATAPYLGTRDGSRFQRVQLASCYQQARLVVAQRRAEVEALREEDVS
jgi:hypothetical protein